jgi:lycopene beta-cyclase
MAMMHYDYVIIGAGAAGLQLALQMVGDEYFSDKSILLLDKDLKDKNDRTWSYWEKGEGRFDDIIYRSWSRAEFKSESLDRTLDLSPYIYKTLRGIDFYEYARTQLHGRITWLNEEVVNISHGHPNVVQTETGAYQSEIIFDSRIQSEYNDQAENFNTLLQHFLGWEVTFEKPVFQPDTFLMMDFRHAWEGATSFMYILPFSEKTALLEYTFFSADLLTDDQYEKMIRSYIRDYIGEEKYHVGEKEKGIIPMTDFPFESEAAPGHYRIGTAGGWVKGSSGYSFRNSMRNTNLLIQNLKSGKPLTKGITRPRFKYYDSVFLQVLSEFNERGGEFFSAMYRNNTPERILKFLDEDTSFLEELRILSSFPKTVFTRAAINRLISGLK